MKKLVFMFATAALVLSCQSKGNKAEMIESEVVEEGIVTTPDPTIEGMVAQTYEGVLPAADCEGVNYNLVILTEEDSVGGDGLYQLTATYLGADNGKDKTLKSKGKKVTLHGTPKNKKATAYKLVPEDGSESINFLVATDSTLTLVGEDFQVAPSNLNYTIKKVKK